MILGTHANDTAALSMKRSSGTIVHDMAVKIA